MLSIVSGLFFTPSVPLQLTMIDPIEIEITEKDFQEAEAITRDDPAVWEPDLEAPPPPAPEAAPKRIVREVARLNSARSVGILSVLGTYGDDSVSDIFSVGV